MAQRESIDLIGAKELDRALSALDSKVARQVAGKALRAGAKIIEDEAKRLAPVKTGALRNAIKLVPGKNRKDYKSVKVAIGQNWFTGDQFYAAFQEFGWKTGARKTQGVATAKRIARALRRASRTAGGLAATGSAFREKQEAFFTREGYRQSAAIERKPRVQIDGKHFMETAYDTKAVEAMDAIIRELAIGIAGQAPAALAAVRAHKAQKRRSRMERKVARQQRRMNRAAKRMRKLAKKQYKALAKASKKGFKSSKRGFKSAKKSYKALRRKFR